MNMIHGDIAAADTPEMEETMDVFSARLGKRLRELRKLRRMTQADLGRHIGTTPQQVQKYEAGLNRVSAPTMVRMAQVLRVSPLLLISSIWPEVEAGDGPPSPAYMHLDVAERVAVIELYAAIKDPVERCMARDLLKLMARARDA